ncbi:HSP18 transcriptional regulator [Streptomyces sp. NPDC058613]|uniref:HSP18 transcriptional regulator n=1 Tax=Streptomyces sp. NPDC058613 TaxID=3346556 RepID=UPI00364667E2
MRDAQQPSARAPAPPGTARGRLRPAPGSGRTADAARGPRTARRLGSGLIETARGEGASWAELAGPLGVASRQAAERRYLLRLRPGTPGSTGEERVQATRDPHAADRTVTAWARDNAADLRRLAAQITALTCLPADAADAVGALNLALGHDDAARLIRPLADTRAHLRPQDAELAAHIDALTRNVQKLRQSAHGQRGT